MEHDLELLRLQRQLSTDQAKVHKPRSFLWDVLRLAFGAPPTRFETERDRALRDGRDLPSRQPGAWPL